jgi:hypothetical protein
MLLPKRGTHEMTHLSFAFDLSALDVGLNDTKIKHPFDPYFRGENNKPSVIATPRNLSSCLPKNK